jgi:hypothetical protein
MTTNCKKTSMETNYPTILPFGIDDNNHTPPIINALDIYLLMLLSPFEINEKGYLPSGLLPLSSCF